MAQNHRRAARQQNQKKPERPLLGILVGAGAAGLVVTLITSALSAAGVVTMVAAGILLFIAWVVSVIAIVCADLIWSRRSLRWPVGVSSAIVSGAVYLSLFFWMQAARPPTTIPAHSDDPEAKLFSDISIRESHLGFDKTAVPSPGLNYYYKNSGQVAVDHQRSAYVLQVLSKMPTDQEIDTIYAAAETRMQISPMFQEELRPGDQNFNTARSTSFDQQAVLDVLSEKKFVLLFIVFQYTDKNAQLPKYRTTEFCGLFTNSFDYWKNCHTHNSSPAVEH